MGGPLEGLNVLDFGQAAVGPYAAMMLGFMGANVIKVERPEGDIMRTLAPFQKGEGVPYTVWNLSKKNPVFNLKDPQGLRDLKALVKEADVISENLRPGVMDKLGIGYDTARALNPSIVYASSPGWGFTGPMVQYPGADSDCQCFSGFASLNGKEGGTPELYRQAMHLDLHAGCILATNILLGLLRLDRTGAGARVTSTHVGSALSLLTPKVSEYVVSGQVPVALGSASGNSAPDQAFQCQDKEWLAVSVETELQWQAFCEAIRRKDLASDPRFATNADRVKSRKVLATELEKVFAGNHSRWWYNQLTRRGVPAGFFYDFEHLRNHASVKENEYIVEMDFPYHGKMTVGGIPWRFSKTPCSMRPADAFGEHTREVIEKGFGAFGPRAARPTLKPATGSDGLPPLVGLRVLDATQGLAGPYAALLLADAGAEVIKVEPPEGDYARRLAPISTTGDGAAFLSLNRNKKGVMLDLGAEKGRASFKKLADNSDVVIEDWGVGKASGMGLDYDALSKRNPGLIYCAITPFGEKGPFQHLAGSELVAQAMSEYWASLGEPSSPPLRVGADIASASTGDMAVVSVLAALYRRNRSGEGQRISISMWGTSLCEKQASWAVLGDEIEGWSGTFCQAYLGPAMCGYKTKDRPVSFRLHQGSEEDYVKLLVDLGMEQYLSDTRFGNAGRDVVGLWGKYTWEVMPIWEKHMEEKPSADIVALFHSHNAIASPINNIKDALEHPQTHALGVLKEIDHPSLGKLTVIGAPFQGPWNALPPTPSPKLGEHTRAVLASVEK